MPRKNDAHLRLKELANQALCLIEIEARTFFDLLELLEENKKTIHENKLYEVLRFMRANHDKGFPIEKRKLEGGIWYYCFDIKEKKIIQVLEEGPKTRKFY